MPCQISLSLSNIHPFVLADLSHPLLVKEKKQFRAGHCKPYDERRSASRSFIETN